MHKQPGITKLEVFFFLILIVVIAGMVPYSWGKSSLATAKAQAINNAKQIGTAMNDFLEEFGNYPSEETRQKLIQRGLAVPTQEDDANSYLSQLLASGTLDSESYFYIKKAKGARKPDNNFSTPETLLSKGENGFGYVMLRGDRPLKSRGSTVPLLVAPLISGGSDPRFDPKPFADQYIYLTPDGAVSSSKISKDGIPIAKGCGKAGLFGADKNSVFGKDIPDVKMPR